MALTNTLASIVFGGDTYQDDEPSKKEALKFRVAAKVTADIGDEYEHIETVDVEGSLKIRLTKRFGRQALHVADTIPNIVDDIKQKFSGVVTDIDYEHEQFSSRISDLSNPNNPDELITLGFDEIQKFDLRQLSIGDSFVWYIGYVQGQMISREGFSKIRFRRLPVWSQQEIEVASSEAEELFDFFHGNTNTTA